MNDLVKQLLLSSNYWVLNKDIVKTIGLEPTFMLGVFADGEKELADNDGWFYQTSATISELTGFSNHKQTQAINKLVEIGVLFQENRGIPCKRYFKINYQKIKELVFKNFENCYSKNSKTSVQKFLNNKEYNINNIDKKNKNNKKETIKEEILNLDISEVLKEKFIEYIDYRKEIKKPLKTIRPIKSEINKIGKEYKDINHLILSIEESMNREYQGIFPIKNYNPISNTTRENKNYNNYNNYNNIESSNVMEKIEAKINTFISLGIIYKSDLNEIKELLEMDKTINPKDIKERLKGIPIVD